MPNNPLPFFITNFENFLLGLFRQFLTGRLSQRLDKLLLVFERVDVEEKQQKRLLSY